MVLYDLQRATAAQRLTISRIHLGQLVVGTWVECRGKIALKRHVTAPLYEQFCLRLHSLHMHQDPYAELHHWLLLQQSRDILYPKNSLTSVSVPPVSLPVRVCELLHQHHALTSDQLTAHLSVSATVLRITITEVR